MIRFLLYLAPALIPLLLCFIWVVVKKKRAKRAGNGDVHIKDGPWLVAFSLSALIAIMIAIVIGVSQQPIKGEYTAPRYEDGRVIEGSVAP